MKTIYIMLVSLLILLWIWLAWSYFGTKNIEKPIVVSSVLLTWGIEVREVAPMIQATVLVTWDQNTAINNWFRQLAGYIFGWNTNKQPVAMTAPVSLTEEAPDNTVIAMTSPVALQEEGAQYRVSFMMPNSFTLDDLPKPTNNNISFVEVPGKKYYVWKFSGYVNPNRANKQLLLFLGALQSQKIYPTTTPILNQYNDPWTIPFMRTNEWWIEIQ